MPSQLLLKFKEQDREKNLQALKEVFSDLSFGPIREKFGICTVQGDDNLLLKLEEHVKANSNIGSAGIEQMMKGGGLQDADTRVR